LKNELGQMPGHEKQLISYIFEKMAINDDDLVELRGFEPMAIAGVVIRQSREFHARTRVFRARAREPGVRPRLDS
jgi:hypothetical protein